MDTLHLDGVTLARESAIRTTTDLDRREWVGESKKEKERR